MKKNPFEPYVLNDKLELKNRFVMAPMTTWSGNDTGTLSNEELAYYAYRSSGAGLVITATTYTEPSGKGFSGQFYAGDDTMLPSLKNLAETIHDNGSKAILQIFHAGRKGNPSELPENTTLSASAISGKREGENRPREMTETEILNTIESFKQTTIRAHKAGFDGIEIHGANTYLLQQFFSPHSNRRTDHWGGTLEKRTHFAKAIIRACFEAKETIADANFIIGYRFSPEENSEPGITLEDTDYLVDELCKTELDYLHISLGEFKQTSMRDQNNSSKIIERLVSKINKRKPFIGVGSVYTLDDAYEMLEYDVDLVAVGRQLLIDGKTIEKWSQSKSAYDLYDADKREEEMIPKILNGIIIDTDGWVPTKI